MLILICGITCVFYDSVLYPARRYAGGVYISDRNTVNKSGKLCEKYTETYC